MNGFRNHYLNNLGVQMMCHYFSPNSLIMQAVLSSKPAVTDYSTTNLKDRHFIHPLRTYTNLSSNKYHIPTQSNLQQYP